LKNGESFFYQQLLLSTPCRTENDLLDNCTSYRQKFLSLHPRFQATIEENCTKVTTNQNQLVLQNQFNTIMTHILDNIASVITPQLTDVLTKQLNALKLLPPILPHNAMLGLPNEQYSVYNTIVNNLGSLQSK